MSGTILHDSRTDNGDGFTATYESSGGRYPRLTLNGVDGEVVVFGIGELEALLGAVSKALSIAGHPGASPTASLPVASGSQKPADAARAA